jgi:hypothetical protein
MSRLRCRATCLRLMSDDPSGEEGRALENKRHAVGAHGRSSFGWRSLVRARSEFFYEPAHRFTRISLRRSSLTGVVLLRSNVLYVAGVGESTWQSW